MEEGKKEEEEEGRKGEKRGGKGRGEGKKIEKDEEREGEEAGEGKMQCSICTVLYTKEGDWKSERKRERETGREGKKELTRTVLLVRNP